MKFVFFIVIVVSFLTGCTGRVKDYVWNNLAEMVDFVVEGRNENVSVELMCGRREVEYTIDGVATALIPYGVITVDFFDDNMDIDECKYILYVGVKKYEGDFQKNPYDETWVADIGEVVNCNANISVDVIIVDNKYSLKLQNTSRDWRVSSQDAVDMLIKNYKDKLKDFVKDSEFMGEIYIKIINDGDNYTSDYYYYISVVGVDGRSFSFLLSPKSNEILASNSTFL